MNISSLVLTTLASDAGEVINELKRSDFCEYHTHKEGKIVVTIEGESVSDEIAIMNRLGQLNKVINVEMIYSYCEDELDKERDFLEMEGKTPEWLNDENAKAEDIKYNGKLPI